MHIQPVETDIRSLFMGSDYFIIPRFQRPYSWRTPSARPPGEQLEEFWNDAIESQAKDYFIGAMVTFRQGKSNKQKVVDGQQRLTTATILLCALRDAFAAEGLSKLASGTHNAIERLDEDENLVYVLKPVTSAPFFQNRVQRFEKGDGSGAPETLPPRTEEEIRLLEAYDYLSKRVQKKVDAVKEDVTLDELAREKKIEKTLKTIRDTVLDLRVIHMTLDTEDEAYVVFETLNTRGLDLRLVDMVKNHIMRCAPAANEGSDVARSTWEDILQVLATSEVNIDPDSFLAHSWVSKHEYVAKNKVFKQLKSVVTAENVHTFLDELQFDVHLYRTLREPSYAKAVGKWTKDNRPLQQSLQALNDFSVLQAMPMALSTMRAWRQKQLRLPAAKRSLKALEDFHFYVHGVSSLSSSGGITGMYSNHARRLANAANSDERHAAVDELIQKLSDRKPSFKEFQVAFEDILYSSTYTSEKRLVKYILYKVQERCAPGIVLDYEDSTIEHLTPEARVRDGSAKPELAYSLGNLILISDQLNSELQERPAIEKLEMMKRAGVALDEHLEQALSTGAWDAKAIRRRRQWMAEYAYKEIWTIK